jgi:hypothetical protein
VGSKASLVRVGIFFVKGQHKPYFVMAEKSSSSSPKYAIEGLYAGLLQQLDLSEVG